MIKTSSHRISFILLLLVVICTSGVYAQNVVTIERFSSAKGVTIDGESVRKLYDARLSIGDVSLVCDSAWQFIDKNEMRAFGNIQIDTPTENIWADTLYYYTNQDLSLLRGRVIILQDSTTLYGKKVDYNFFTKVAYFRDGIRLEDSEGTLTALKGTYFQNQDSAIFRINVQIEDTAQYAEGDSLFINRNTKHLELFSNVFVSDSSNNALLTGDYLEADSTGRRYVSGNAYLRKVEADSVKSDSTHINANEILLLEQDSTSLIKAYGGVSVWAPKFSSLSDTLFFDSKKELFELISSPKAWHKNIQLTGPFIEVQLDSSEVRELKSFSGTIAVQEDSVTGRLSQLKGDTLIASFQNGDISKIELYPNSEILYHTKNDAGEADGAMESSSPETILYFDKGELTRAKMGQNQGLFLPEYTDLVNRRLDGFVWDPELRPEKPNYIPEPRFKPIPINLPFTLPQRYLEFIDSSSE